MAQSPEATRNRALGSDARPPSGSSDRVPNKSPDKFDSKLTGSDAARWEQILSRHLKHRSKTIFLFQDGDHTRPRLLTRHRLNNRRLRQQVLRYKELFLESGLLEEFRG